MENQIIINEVDCYRGNSNRINKYATTPAVQHQIMVIVDGKEMCLGFRNRVADSDRSERIAYSETLNEKALSHFKKCVAIKSEMRSTMCHSEEEYNEACEYNKPFEEALKHHAKQMWFSQGQESMKLYKVIDPNNWGKLIGRVNGVNFTGLYGGTTAMGWNTIKKPDHFTWKQYMYFLLDTLPEDTRENYLRKLKTSFAYWLDHGGALPAETVKELDPSIEFENLGKPTNNRNYTTEYQVIKFKEYLDEIDIKNPNLLPTYKRMCIAIMKNDTSCKTLGFGQTKEELKRRKKAINKYKSIL